jgi:S1-C subfamily serine protease
VGRDPRSDLAVLKIANVKNLPAAQLGDSDKLRVGDWAIAVGNPLGFNSTVTLGIISALNRRNLGAENQTLDRVIQTDAAINPGNSGGALADISGRVVGINTAIISRTGTSIGIGFAIPINQARRIVDQLVKTGSVVRPYLGVRYAGIDDLSRRRLPPGAVLPDDDRGAVVIPQLGAPGVTPGSPADKAGLREFDVIREIAGRPVTSVDVIKDEVLKRGVGEKIPLTVFRAGRTLRLTITLEKMPTDFGREKARREPLLPFGLP